MGILWGPKTFQDDPRLFLHFTEAHVGLRTFNDLDKNRARLIRMCTLLPPDEIGILKSERSVT